MLQFTPYGVRLYRSTEDVRRDIARVRECITQVRERLDIRDLVVASVQSVGHPRDAIPTLRQALADAEESLGRLRQLQAELTMLQEELYELL